MGKSHSTLIDLLVDHNEDNLKSYDTQLDQLFKDAGR